MEHVSTKWIQLDILNWQKEISLVEMDRLLHLVQPVREMIENIQGIIIILSLAIDVDTQ